MNSRIKIDSTNAPTEFHRAFLWYVDHGMGEPSRRQSYKTLESVLGIPVRTLERWVNTHVPAQWRLILDALEREYGPVPKSVLKGK